MRELKKPVVSDEPIEEVGFRSDYSLVAATMTRHDSLRRRR